jgi:hypothetical protein
MSVEAPKPAVVPEASPAPVDFTPVAVSEVAGEKTIVPAAELPKVEEQPKVEGDAAVTAPVEEKQEDDKVEEKAEEKAEEKVVEPIYSGALGYKAPGLKK